MRHEYHMYSLASWVWHTICRNVVWDRSCLTLEDWRWGRKSEDGLLQKSDPKACEEIERRRHGSELNFKGEVHWGSRWLAYDGAASLYTS